MGIEFHSQNFPHSNRTKDEICNNRESKTIQHYWQ